VEVVKHLRRSRVLMSRAVDRALLPIRFWRRTLSPVPGNRAVIGVDAASIPLHFINLASRPDRLRETEVEFARMELAGGFRFEAVKEENGALGCALSHGRLLESVDVHQLVVMVCEDDIEFLVSPQELRALLEEFLANPALDVLCLAFNLIAKAQAVSPLLAITANTATTACYVVKRPALERLEKSFLESARLIQEGQPLGLAAADQHWKKLQRRGVIFAVPRTRAARQRASFSDIEGQEVSYGV
jgi:glycosyl transferase, family 25